MQTDQANDKGKSLCLLPGKQYAVGRKGTDLILEGDQSVSRKHAAVIVTSNQDLDINTPPSTLKLVDANSKYGTFIKVTDEWDKLLPGEERVLVNTDTVRFGVLANEWRVMYVPLIVTMSNLNLDDKEQLRSTLMSIDGYMMKTWGSSLTHLTMKSITLTIKAICAMACGKPIVTPEYWNKYLEMARNNKELPDCNDFIPPLKEPTIDASSVSLAVNDERRNVFRGKHFVFASRIDLKELGCMVTAAGGTAAAFDEYVNSFDQLCLPGVILISCSFITSRSAPTQQVHLIEPFNKAKSYLESRGRRVIADQEIGYAILYCSIEKYCNPQRNLNNTVSSSSNMSQVLGSRATLDFSSQAVDRPTQEIASPPRILRPVMDRTNKQPVVQKAGSQQIPVDSDQSTFAYSVPLSTCASSRDIFVSPVKVEQTSVKQTYEPCDNRKRQRTLELDDLPETKRPSRVDNVLPRNVPIKLENEDLFSFATDNLRQKRTRPDNDSEEEDEFSFSNRTKPKREKSTCPTEYSNDLFMSPANMSMESNGRAQPQQAVETRLPDSTLGSVRRGAVPTSRSSEPPVMPPQQRKKPVRDEQVVPPLKKSLDSTARTTSTKTPVSLQGFLNTTCVKTDNYEMDDLTESVKDIFLIEEKLLVVREKTRLALSLNETKNVSHSGTTKNFKRFHKILPINRSILPRIIGGKDLYIYKGEIENKFDITPDDKVDRHLDRHLNKEKEKDEWAFPVPGQSVNKSIRMKSRK